MTIDKIIEALETTYSEEGKYMEDGFVTETVTVSFDNDDNDTDDIKVTGGDWRHYYQAYNVNLLLSESDTEEDIVAEVERIENELERIENELEYRRELEEMYNVN